MMTLNQYFFIQNSVKQSSFCQKTLPTRITKIANLSGTIAKLEDKRLKSANPTYFSMHKKTKRKRFKKFYFSYQLRCIAAQFSQLYIR